MYEVFSLPVSELQFPERNVRIHGEKQIAEYARSLEQFTQYVPIIIDENNVILKGCGCCMALQKLGRETALVSRLTGLSENQKKKLMMADNKISALGVDNTDTFNAFIEELCGDLSIPGYDEDILRSMVSDAQEITERLSGYGSLDPNEIDTIRAAGPKIEAAVEKATNAPPSANERREEPRVYETSEEKDDTDTYPESVDPAERRRCITCPKCGEVIWL